MPCFIMIVALYGYPIVMTLVQSFHKINLLGGQMDFVGLSNFKKIFADPGFYKTLRITFKYTFVTVILKIGLGFLSAFLLSKALYGKKLLRFLFLIPWAIPQVAVSTLFTWILNGDYGYLNYFLLKFNLISQPIRFLSNPDIALYCVGFVDAWIGISLVAMMFLSGLQAINFSLYEACEIDGGGAFRKFIDVTVPGIKQVFMTTLILVTIWTFNSFNVIYVLTQGGPMRSTETLIIRIYEEAFSRFDLGMSATLSVISFVILLVLTFFYIRRLINNEES